MLAGSVLMLGSAAVFVLLGNSITGLVVGSVVLGTGHLLTVVSQQAAVANTAGPGRFDTAFGHYTFAASLGQAIGPGLIVVAGGASAIPNTEVIFVAATVLGGLLVVCTRLLVACTLRLRVPTRDRDRQDAVTGGISTLLRIPGLLRALLISCVVLSAVDISLVFLPALGADRGLASGFIGLLLVLRAVASMGSRLFLGRLVELVGRRRLMMVSVSLSAAAMVAITIPMPDTLMAVTVVLLGLGLGVGQPLTMSWLAECAPAGLRGRAMSLRLTGNRLGQVIIPSVVGFVAVGVGAAGVLWATAGTLGAAAVAARRIANNPVVKH